MSDEIKTREDGQKYTENSDGSRVLVYPHPDNMQADFVPSNPGVPNQVGLGQINPDQAEKDAQLAAAEAEAKPAKKTKKGGK